MIHTAEFYAILDNETVFALEDKFRTTTTLINENIDLNEFNAVKFYFYKTYGVWKFNLYVDFIKLLDKPEIDYLEIEKRLSRIILSIFDYELSRVEIILKRLDFRKDIKVSKQVRLEIRLFPRHLNSQKREKTLKAYLTNEVFQKYMENNTFPIFYKGNHYKLELIDKILNDTDMKAKEKNDILTFIKYISLYGYSSAINKKNDKGELKWSSYKVRKYIKLLERLNINPFIIPIREEVDMIENRFML